MVVGEWGGSIVGDPKAAANQQTLARWFVKACIPDTFWWCVLHAKTHLISTDLIEISNLSLFLGC